MRLDHNFFCTKSTSKPKDKKASLSTNHKEKQKREGDEDEGEEEDEELGVQIIFHYITSMRTLFKVAYV